MHSWLVRNIVYPLHEQVFGRSTFACLHQLELQQWLPAERLADIRLRKLKELLVHARDNVPFYRERFRRAGFEPEGMAGLEDLSALPTLSKGEIKQNLESMLWRAAPGGLERYNTGGSSGEPLIFYFDRRRQSWDKAARMLTHQWFGHKVGDRELYLWGSPVEMGRQDRLKELRDSLTNELLLSAFELSEDNVEPLFERMRGFKPHSLFGYPSSVALFAEMARAKGLDPASLGIKMFFSTAEKLYDHQRQAIQQAWKAPVADCYGSREGGFVAHECEKGVYHVMDPNYVLELLVGDRPAGPDEDGEIVLTHLDAWGMPFVRYRTGDVARRGPAVCDCGRGFSTLGEVQGRTTDFIVTPDGRWQHALSLIYIVRDIPGVREFKILQEAVDHVRVLLALDETRYPADGDDRIREGFAKRMGPGVAVGIEPVDEVPREASGKFRYVVSKVAGQGYGGGAA